MKTFWALVLSLAAGCISVPIDKNYNGPEPLPAKYDVLTSPKNSRTSVVLREKLPTYSIYDLFIGSSRSSLYVPKISKKVPVVLITPGMGGGDLINEILAEGCVDNDIAAIILDQPNFLSPQNDGSDLELALEYCTRNARSVVDWVCSQKRFDSENIGSVGYSMGAIRNMVLAAVDQRIRSHVFIMGAGNLPKMILESEEAKRYVFERKKNESLNDDELLKDLENIILDPADLAKYIDARNVLMVISRFDSIVPTRRQEEIRRLMGCPRTIYIPTGHATGALTIFYLRKKMVEFYKQEFIQDN